MRVLLDDDLDVRLRHHFGDVLEVVTVQYRGWKGLENGDLLRAAAEEFDVLVTGDDNLPFQQNVPDFDLSIVILRAKSNALADLLDLMPEVRRRLPELEPGEVVRVRPSSPGDE